MLERRECERMDVMSEAEEKRRRRKEKRTGVDIIVIKKSAKGGSQHAGRDWKERGVCGGSVVKRDNNTLTHGDTKKKTAKSNAKVFFFQLPDQ